MFKSPKLSVITEQDTYFIYPPTEEVDFRSNLPDPDAETVVNGYVRVVLPKPLALAHLCVKLETSYSLNTLSSSHTETGHLYSKQYDLDLHNRVFSAGQTEFRFSFVLPNTTPATDRKGASIVVTHISACLTMPRRPAKTLQAEKKIECITATRPNELPEGISIQVEEHSVNLGPYRVEAVSDSLTVGSLFNLRLYFDQPVRNCKIKQILCQIITTTSIHGKEMASSNTNIFQVKETKPTSPAASKLLPPLPDLQEGKSAEFAITARLPTDEYIKPTTHAATRSPIRTQHHVLLTILYAAEGGKKDQAITVRKPIHIASCSCMLETMLLPAYEAKDRTKKANHPACICGYAFSALVEASPISKNWASMSGLLRDQKEIVKV